MIIVRSPLRIPLGGGGTDLPSYYSDHGGYVISAAINKYVYVTAHTPFANGIWLKYAKIEKVKSINKVRHPIIRETLKYLDFENIKVEISTVADIPAGTGLGSSGSFTTALIKCLKLYQNFDLDKNQLANMACHIELNLLNEPIGKQDQYVSAYGGINEYHFSENGNVEVSRPEISNDTVNLLEENLLLFYTGQTRSASMILRHQNTLSLEKDLKMTENLHQVKDIGLRTSKSLQESDMETFALLMNEHWELKRRRSENISNTKNDYIYSEALSNGAIGGKIIGAGGGGFFCFYSGDKTKLRKRMSELKLPEVRFNFDFEGTKSVLS